MRKKLIVRLKTCNADAIESVFSTYSTFFLASKTRLERRKCFPEYKELTSLNQGNISSGFLALIDQRVVSTMI